MTKIFSTPKEVLTRVEAIPPADMEKIQEALSSFCGNDIHIQKKIASLTVVNELERAGWAVINPSDSYTYYVVRPKNMRLKLRPGVTKFGPGVCLLLIPSFILFTATCWDHVIPGMLITGLFVIAMSLLTITDV